MKEQKQEKMVQKQVLENETVSERLPRYDGGYKQELSNKKQFIHFMKKYVKAEWCEDLTEDQITLCNREFQLEDYQKRQADLVYKIRLKDQEVVYVYLIMELQSRVDFTMPFRLLTLMYAFMLKTFMETDVKEREKKDFRLPVAIPVLFYNGEHRWTAETEFRNYLKGNSLFGEYMINFKYYLVDLSQIKNDYIMSSNTLIDNILALDKNRKNNELLHMLDVVEQRMKQLPDADRVSLCKWLENILIASSRRADDTKIQQLIEAMLEGDVQMIHGLQKTIMEEYDAGKKLGHDLGVVEGRDLGIAEGRDLGIAEGEQRLSSLIQKLIAGARSEEIEKAVTDKEFREKLYGEFGL